MKIAIVVGTRPEIIKMYSLISLCSQKEIEFVLIHTNQHYSHDMDAVFFQELNLPKPHYNLSVGSGSHGRQTGMMLERLEEVFQKEKPDIVLVEGDTNTVVAGALAAAKLNIKVGHVEAGLRSYDRTMPEEVNRIIADHVADFLFCPTELSRDICVKEGIPSEKLFVVGNTIVDVVLRFSPIAQQRSKILGRYQLQPGEYALLTAHRPANVDAPENLQKLFTLTDAAAKHTQKKILYPLHPRTRMNIERHSVVVPTSVQVIEPVSFFDFQMLLMNSAFVLTDSGGVQEEACIQGIPCLTLRENTERPETLFVGSNKLIGLDIDQFKSAVDHFSQKKKWDTPFGDGRSGEAIITILQHKFS